jgi:glycosyltransferase involved in cell wall biosynthesis
MNAKTTRRVMFVIPSLGGGGAERACVTLLRHLDRGRISPSLALYRRKGPFLAEVPDDVPVHDLGLHGMSITQAVRRLARLIRRERPDVVMGIMRHPNLVCLLAAALARCGTRVVVNEQNHLRAEFDLYGGGLLKGIAVRCLYPRAAAVTAISRGIGNELAHVHDVPQKRLMVIPNPVDVEAVSALARKPIDDTCSANEMPMILAAGRLHPQKGFPHLIRAFARVRPSLPARLVIIGEGPERAALEALVAGLDLQGAVVLPGFQSNPYAWMARADLFVLSSLYEGFGNVITEAMALGVPIVATRCPSGPEEIITEGQDGLLVPVGDEEALAAAMRRILTSPTVAADLRRGARERAVQYDAPLIARRYADLFEALCVS